MKVLVINCGSSSIKYQLYEMPDQTVLAKGLVEIGAEKEGTIFAIDHGQGLKLIMQTLVDQKTGVLKSLEEIKAVGHRVVHGGEGFSGSVEITAEVLKVIEDYSDLAPLHNPPNLAGINAATAALE